MFLFVPLLAQATGPQGPPVLETESLALVGATILPSPEAEPIRDGVVWIEGPRIRAVGAREALDLPEEVDRLDATGFFLVAGFQNSHVHLTEEERWADAGRAEPARLQAHMVEMFLKYGFTTVVDTGSLPANTLALRARVEAGELSGPRILTAGGPLYPVEGIPYYLRESLPAEVLPLLATPRTPAEAIELVDGQLALGVDALKLFTGSWVERGRVLPMDEAIAMAAATCAHERSKLVLAHASSVAGLEVALSAGVDVLAHCLDDERGLESMQAAGLALVPTLALFHGQPGTLRQVGDYARLGGVILFGTDVGFHPDPDPSEEYALMRRAGLDSRAILRSLTTAPAERFGEGSRRGTIAAGMDADLVALGSDPLAEAGALGDVRWVMRAGRIIFEAR